MQFLMYELALHPDIRHRLRTAVTQILDRHNQDVIYDEMREMTFLDTILSAEFSFAFVN
jgi:hypothetical protein